MTANTPHIGVRRDGEPPARDPFVVRTIIVLALLLLSAMLAALVVLGIGILFAAFAGVLVAIALVGAANALCRRTPLPYGVALTVVVLGILAIFGAAGRLLGGQIVQQADEFGAMLPDVAADVESYLQQHAWGRWILDQASGGGEDGGGGAGGMGMGVLAWLSNASSYVLVALFVGLFGATNPRMYVDGIVALTPLRHRDGMKRLLAELGHTLRWWLVGQAAAMVLIGVSTTIVLLVFGVPLALVIGLLVGLLGFIPYLGPIIGLVPVTLAAATAGTDTLLYVLLAYTAVQMLEGYVAMPLIHERTVYLPPVFTIIAQMLLGAVLGIKGFVLATPIAAVVLVLARFYRVHFLGDEEARREE